MSFVVERAGVQAMVDLAEELVEQMPSLASLQSSCRLPVSHGTKTG